MVIIRSTGIEFHGLITNWINSFFLSRINCLSTLFERYTYWAWIQDPFLQAQTLPPIIYIQNPPYSSPGCPLTPRSRIWRVFLAAIGEGTVEVMSCGQKSLHLCIRAIYSMPLYLLKPWELFFRLPPSYNTPCLLLCALSLVVPSSILQ